MADDGIVDRKQAQLNAHANEMRKITEHPSWGELRLTFQKAKETGERKLARQILTGREGAKPINQRVIDYRRGFIAGCEAVLDHPEMIQKIVERAMENKEGTD